MMSRSCISLADLAYGDMMNVPWPPRHLPMSVSAGGIVSEIESNEAVEDSDDPSLECSQKTIIVADLLPLNAQKDLGSGKWSFSYNEDSLLLQMKDGLSANTKVVYVGSLEVKIDADEQDEVSRKLLDEFNCIPTFLPPEIQEKFYDGFCKHHLWPLFHYVMPSCAHNGNLFDRPSWQAYVTANKIFADKVMEVINPEEDYIWIHDYQLMILPTILRKRFIRVKLGFFLHTPFPSSEIYRSLPVRNEILKALLNADLVGFQTFDYARHFLSCCSRMLGLNYESKRGYIGIEYLGRTVYIKILPVGVHTRRVEAALNHPSSTIKVREIKEQFKDKIVVVGVDDMDIFKGINLKLLAMEELLRKSKMLHGKIVLVQIIYPPRCSGKDVDEAKSEIFSTAERINDVFGSPDYKPVVLIYGAVSPYEKAAYFALADCCIVNALRDGMNLVAYEYTISRQGTPKMDEALGLTSDSHHTSTLVVSEFAGCSPSLSGAIRVSPWDIEAVANAILTALQMPDVEKQLRHEKHYRYVSSHDISYWARSFVQDLERACKDHYSNCCWGIGFGLNFRVLSLSPNFKKLSIDQIVSAYKRMHHRAIFLDYDGTMVPHTSIVTIPSPEVISVLNDLCRDPKNTVFIVSGRGKDSLGDWFAECEKLGIAAEHGYFIRWNSASDWDISPLATDFHWKRIAEPVMKMYTEATDGSYIETKKSALVWHHRDAGPDFGSVQAKELLDHLENVLANEPVVVKTGQHIVEVKPQGVTKGLVAEKVLSTMTTKGSPADFVLCIGDDRSDEDMFESILNAGYAKSQDIFACTVGQKPSKARYYLDDTREVIALLKGLASVSRLDTEA